MKKRNIIIIAAVAAVGLIALLVAQRGSRKATFKQDYHIEDIASVSKIYMADKENNEVTLSRTADSTWLVDGKYEGNKPMIDILLETLNTMRIRKQVNHAAIPNIVKDLAAHSIKVEVYETKAFINWFGGRLRLFEREKLARTYYVGRETQDMMGSYMLREGDKVPCIIHIPGFRGFLTPRFVTDPLKWRSHLIADLSVDRIERIALDIPAMPEESFAVVRRSDGQGFDLELTSTHTKVSSFDTARVAQMLSSFTWLNFDEFASIVPDSFADSCVSVEPRTILHITSTDGETHEVKSYIKYTNPNDLSYVKDPNMYEMFDVDRLYAIVDNKDTVLIQFYAFDNILQPASYFLGKDTAIPMQ